MQELGQIVIPHVDVKGHECVRWINNVDNGSEILVYV